MQPTLIASIIAIGQPSRREGTKKILAEPINFDVYIKNNKIVKIEAENIEGIMKFSTDEEFKNIKKLSFSLELSDNKETVEISDDVKKRALTENAYKRMILINN